MSKLLKIKSPLFVFLLAVTQPLWAGPAIGQFEVKDLEVELGVIEFQSQNAHSFEQPNRKFINEDGDLEFDDNEYTRQRHALEIEIGVTEFMRSRVGVEFEKERFDEPESAALANSFDELKLTELAFETVVVFLPPEQKKLGIGVLAEIEFPVSGGDESNSIIFGPILQYDLGDFQALANTTFINHFSGEDNGKWDFTYATRLLYQHSVNWSYAIEAYGTIDRLGDSGKLTEEALLFGDHDQHRIGPIAYYTVDMTNPRSLFGSQQDIDNASLNIGLGWFVGLNNNTPDHTFKWSIEYEF